MDVNRKEETSKEREAEMNGVHTMIVPFQMGSEMDDLEKSKIAIMRALLRRESQQKSQDEGEPEEEEVEADDWTLRRFLRARDMDIEKASNMFLKYIRWRRSFIPSGSVSEAEIATDLGHNKLFMQGHDKTGRPIVVVFGARHKQAKLDDFKRYVVYTLDKICARMPSGHEKFTSIADLQGWGYSNCDVRGYLGALSILQDCYPERLGKLFIVHVPYIFMTAWKMVYPFIDSNTKKKITFVENKKLKSTLLNEIDESQLPETYGGKLSLVPIQHC